MVLVGVGLLATFSAAQDDPAGDHRREIPGVQPKKAFQQIHESHLGGYPVQGTFRVRGAVLVGERACPRAYNVIILTS
jgi:hypothetical protein